MDKDSSALRGTQPRTVYATRLRQLNGAQTSERKLENLLGYVKVVLAFITLISAIFLLRKPSSIEFLSIPAAAFVVLAVLHEKRIRSLRLRERIIHFYERGLARLEDRWAGTGETGERFLDPLHPYARDLDLFGRTSLFELLCTARTRAGEETLARWLLTAAPVEEILSRQSAIRELKDRVEFREILFSLGDTVRAGVHPGALAAWGERKPIFKTPTTRVVTSALVILWVLSVLSWVVLGWSTAAFALTVLNLAWSHRIHVRWDEAADKLEEAARDLDVLAGVLALIELGDFSSRRLQGIQAALKHDGVVPSRAIRKLNSLAGYVASRRNPAMRLLDVLTFWSAQFVFAAESWQGEFGPHISGWLAAVGEFEALTSVAGYAYEHPDDVFPQLVDRGPLFEAEGLTHPLLPLDNAIRNDVMLGNGLQLIVLSGPNMAGKSTFIRSVGVNAVLAQCGAPVRATGLRLSTLAVAASICVLDSLAGGVSRFYAEIHKLKLAADLALGSPPVLFLFDELLSGTNSHDRLEGTRLLVQSLIGRGAIGIVSTHDLALAQIPAGLGKQAVNRHFEDRLENGKLIFDYKLRDGVVKSSNALELMRSIGLGEAMSDIPPVKH